MTVDIAALRQWIGRTEVVEDTLAAFPAAALAAALDRADAPGPGAALPPLWHWVYLHSLPRQSELAENGHRRVGGFLPPVPFPRRMFAGARLAFLRPLRIGERARRVSTVADVSLKKGASGALVFVRLHHEISGAEGRAIVEDQDLVYREAPRAHDPEPPAQRAGESARWSAEFTADVALLFRYSALLFNAFRIHYDRPYALAQGYAGLVVHGQLVATLLADLALRGAGRPLAAFGFRALRPLYDSTPCRLCGVPEQGRVRLWAEAPDGALLLRAEAELARE